MNAEIKQTHKKTNKSYTINTISTTIITVIINNNNNSNNNKYSKSYLHTNITNTQQTKPVQT